MLRALHSAATGMEAQQTYIDVTSNNLANVNTVGFKKVRANFQDLIYQLQRAPGLATSQATESPTGIQVGIGVKTASTQKEYSVGSLKATNNPFDVAIDGDGFGAPPRQFSGPAARGKSRPHILLSYAQASKKFGCSCDRAREIHSSCAD